MPVLVDVNILLALASDAHVHHVAATQWLDTLGAGEANVCRLVQMGLLRLLNNPAVMNDDLIDPATCWEIWRQFLQDDRIRYSPTEPTGLDDRFEQFTLGRKMTANAWTDAYLAAYAQSSGLTLATFDKGFRRFAGLSCDVITP